MITIFSIHFDAQIVPDGPFNHPFHRLLTPVSFWQICIIFWPFTFWGKRCARLTLYLSCSDPKLSHPRSCFLLVEGSTVSPLHTDLQVVNFQGCERAFHQRQAWATLAACPPSPIAGNPSAAPPLPRPVSNSSCLFAWCQPLYTSCYTVLLCFSRCRTVRLKMFSSLFVIYYLCEKYYELITYNTVWPVASIGYLG